MCFTLQLELKVKMVEAKFHEDKLKIQQQHDVAVQKVIIYYRLSGTCKPCRSSTCPVSLFISFTLFSFVPASI